MPTYTFSCPECGYRWDQRVAFDTRNHPCPHCPWLGYRESVYRIGVSGFARTPVGQSDLSREFKAYEEASQEIAYKSDRAGVELPPLAQIAQTKARELHRKGVTVDDLS